MPEKYPDKAQGSYNIISTDFFAFAAGFLGPA
jgi:hypothetical protein